MSTNWQLQRSQLNHNWLQNGVLVGLSHALGVASGKLRPINIREVMARDIQLWQERCLEVPPLLDRLENEMSPRVLFDRVPLSCCPDDTKRWLIPLIHESWLQREKIREKIKSAKLAYRNTEKTYLSVKFGLKGISESQTAAEMKPFKCLLQEFRDSCETLSLAISALPREILTA